MSTLHMSDLAAAASAEAANGFTTIRVLKQFDKVPFDQLAKLSSKSTLVLGAVPAAVICALFCAFGLLAVVRLGLTWGDMGRAMRSPESRDG